ncbi:MAG: PQQ-binding-like beta-propeller repeat protein [Planctomycetota bacterium]|nr:PQQ-binding-like beta-propeller repeat protein [Planctomycetota bacterium]MDA1140885.1 PQQ-binding-like beta-propeller repeat protein [Planctomycetota bacterium]
MNSSQSQISKADTFGNGESGRSGAIALLLALLVTCHGCGNGAKTTEPAISFDDQAPPVGRTITPSESWTSFANDGQHSGWSSAEFSRLPDEPTWTFSPGAPLWDYKKGISVWSSPAIAMVDSLPRVFIGSYDHHLYSIDALTGKKQWAFTAGDGIFSTPVIGNVEGDPVVVFGSADRTVYALFAKTGDRRWTHETFLWSDTVAPCRMSSPVLTEIAGKPVVLIAAANNDRQGLKNIQKGELLALDLSSGELIWAKTLTSTFITSPCIGEITGGRHIFVACQDGTVRALECETGKTRWKYTANELIYSSVSFAVIHGRPLVFFGTRHNSTYALDATTGKSIWKHKCGYWIDSTPAFADVDRRPMVFIGSYDRGIYGLDARTGKEVWKKSTREWVSASPLIASLAGKTTVFVSSLDRNLYAYDASTGERAWSFDGGDFIWSHIQQGDALWSSPTAAKLGEHNLLIYPSFSYRIHGFVGGRN